MALVNFENVSSTIGKITLNDPDRLNAMSEEMAVEVRQMTKVIGEKSGIRAIILTGAGRAFSAGGDLEMLQRKTKLSGEENRTKMLDYYDSFLGLLSLRIPIIAAINGLAIGAGLCLASACDIRIASQKAKLGFTFVKLGLHPGMGATYFLPRILGFARASELLLTGRVIESTKALEIGLVSGVFSEDKLMEEAVRVAEEISAAGPESIRQLLDSLRVGPSSLANCLEREALAQGINYASAEFREGVAAVAEKRVAKFVG